MLCAITGVIAAAVVLYKRLGVLGYRAELRAPLLVYRSPGLTVAFVVHLTRYGS